MITKRQLPFLASLLLAVAACETAPPVQEMSDARQAIDVARQSGAEVNAATQLNEALRLLEAAEHELDVEDYSRARRSAMQAKSKALEARSLSESSRPR